MSSSFNLLLVLSFLLVFATLLSQCDARKLWNYPKKKATRLKVTKHLTLNDVVSFIADSSSNTQPYISSPFSLPPFDSIAPIPQTDNSPPYCIYPPGLNPPQTPPASIPTPTSPGPFPTTPTSPGPFPTTPTLPNYPPSISTPSPPQAQLSPSPPYYSFSPPPAGTTYNPPTQPNPPISYEPSPPTIIVPGPPVFLPPVVYPPPAVPPPHTGFPGALWCVVKPAVPEPIILEAMNYACGSGADCEPLQPSGPCFRPNNLFAHASFAFNSYWQRTKVAGGTCSFGGTAILVTVDPSHDGCHFEYS